LVLAAAIATTIAANAYGSLDVGARPGNVVYAPPRILLAYGLGILLWRLSLADRTPRLPGWLAKAAMPAAMLISWYTGYRAWPFDLVFVIVLCPLAIVAALGITREHTLARFSADIAFPLFAVHVPALELVRMAGYGPQTGLPAAFALALAILWWTKRGARRMEPAKA
jgi:peptidoglycan/LPS O-acetylase OafA/YrhL